MMISVKNRKLAHEWQYDGMAQRWKERAYKVRFQGVGDMVQGSSTAHVSVINIAYKK